MKNILHLDASARQTDSQTRRTSKALTELVREPGAVVTHRNLDRDLPLLNEEMVGSYFTAPDNRTSSQVVSIERSESVVKDLQDHDIYVIGVPVYNFSMPAAFKAWADLAARVGVTFKYTENGPQGLLEGKRAYLVVASGGTEIGSPIDFLTPWAKHFLGFLGVKDVTVIPANKIGDDINALEAILRETDQKAA